MRDPNEEEEDDQYTFPLHEDDEIQDGMKSSFPGSTREGRDTGRMLGVDFPYVPGDPFW